jgi:hydrogenase maturation protease
MMPRVLIIAYGNPLRSDDGVAWYAAECLRDELPALGTQILCVHQLTPELAETASRTDDLIFLDASRNGEPGQIVCAPLDSQPGRARFSHQHTPEQIVSLCKQLYGTEPRAFVVSINGESFAHGDGLSTTLRDALPRLVRIVGELIERLSMSSQDNAAAHRHSCVEM